MYVDNNKDRLKKISSKFFYLNKFAFLEVLPCRLSNWSVDQLHDVLFLAPFNYFIIGTLLVHIKAPCKYGIDLKQIQMTLLYL